MTTFRRGGPEMGPSVKSSETIEIAGVTMPVMEYEDEEAKMLIPDENSAYIFPSYTPDLAQDIIENKRVLLTGHTGSGKTSLFMQIASLTGQPILRANLNGQTTVGDFVGLWTVRGGETQWVDGTLPHAMRNGFWLILDEIDFAEPAVLAVLNSVLETNGSLVLKEAGHEVVIPHPNFRIFATANTVGVMAEYRSLYQGTGIFNEAFLDRWRVYYQDYLPPDKEAKVVAETVARMNVKITTVLIKVVNMVRDAHRREEVACTFSTRRAIEWAELMVRHRHPMKAAEASIFAKISREDAEVIRGIIKRVMKVDDDGFHT